MAGQCNPPNTLPICRLYHFDRLMLIPSTIVNPGKYVTMKIRHYYNRFLLLKNQFD